MPLKDGIVTLTSSLHGSYALNSGGSMLILLVEDDRSVAHVLVMLIEHLGHQVEVLDSAQEAWEKYEQGENRFDVVISDNQTGDGITGLEFLTRLRGNPHTSNQRFILMSGRTTSEGKPLAEICRTLDASFYPKPILLETLKSALG